MRRDFEVALAFTRLKPALERRHVRLLRQLAVAGRVGDERGALEWAICRAIVFVNRGFRGTGR